MNDDHKAKSVNLMDTKPFFVPKSIVSQGNNALDTAIHGPEEYVVYLRRVHCKSHVMSRNGLCK